jgi:hypothetical protein
VIEYSFQVPNERLIFFYTIKILFFTSFYFFIFLIFLSISLSLGAKLSTPSHLIHLIFWTRLSLSHISFIFLPLFNYTFLQVVAQSAVNHALWSGGHKFESILPLPLCGHVKKKKKNCAFRLFPSILSLSLWVMDFFISHIITFNGLVLVA